MDVQAKAFILKNTNTKLIVQNTLKKIHEIRIPIK